VNFSVTAIELTHKLNISVDIIVEIQISKLLT